MYLRLSKSTRIFLRRASYVALVVVNVSGVVMTFMTIFRCQPVRAAYTPDIQEAQCISIQTLYLASAPVNVVTNLAILVLPIPVLTAMKLPRRQKSILLLTFLLGVFVTVVDVVRIYYLQVAAASLETLTSTNSKASLKFSYSASFALLWSVVEVNIGIICACIPVMRPLIEGMLFGKAFGRANLSNGKRALLRRASTVSDSGDTGEHQQQATMDVELGSETLLETCQGRQTRVTDQAEALDANLERMTTALGSKKRAPQGTVIHVYPDWDPTTAGLKSMLKMQDFESIKYCISVTIVYSFWGFAFALLIVLNSEIPIDVDPTPIKGVGVGSASFGGRIFGPILGIWVLRKTGFKKDAHHRPGHILCWGAHVLALWISQILPWFPCL